MIDSLLLIIFSVVMAADLELIPMPAIERQLFSIEEQEDSSIKVFDRSNGSQIYGFDNAIEMVEGMLQVIQQMEEYYASKNVTDIKVIR